MAIEATCDGCGKTWKVPDPDRTYKCKDCGGHVAVAQEAPEPEPEPGPAAGGPEKKQRAGQPFAARRAADAAHAPDSPEAKRRKLVFMGVVGVVVIGVIIGVAMAGKPPAIEDRADLFEEAWASGSLDNLRIWFMRQWAKDNWEEIEDKFKSRGWTETRPALKERVIKDATDNSASVDYMLTGHKFQTRWVLHNDDWKIGGMLLGKYDPSKDPRDKKVERSLQTFTEKFRKAWNEKTYPAIAGLASQSNAPKWATRIDFYGDKYGDRVLEEIPDVSWLSRIRARVLFNSPNGVVRTSWTFKQDWELTGLAFK